MAMKFEEKDGEGKPIAKKEVGGKIYVAEEPAPETSDALPFGKPVKAEKKGRRK